MMALLYETVPSFEDTWIECLRELDTCCMAIEDDKPVTCEMQFRFAQLFTYSWSYVGSGCAHYPAAQFAMLARMWRHGIHSFLELFRHLY
jgi:hypothetical protein